MKKVFSFLLFIILLVSAAAGGWYYASLQEKAATQPVHQPLSREGVLTEIKRLNRLESTAFHIDTKKKKKNSF